MTMQQPMLPFEKEGNSFNAIVSHNAELKRNYNDIFHQTFGVSLFKFMHPIFGFDVVSFDENFIRPPEGVSTADAITQKYGLDARRLIEKLIE